MTAVPASFGPGRLEDSHSRVLMPLLAALCVGLLTFCTLGTLASMSLGVAVHLFGVSDGWAVTVGASGAIAGLIPGAALARNAWRFERETHDA